MLREVHQSTLLQVPRKIHGGAEPPDVCWRPLSAPLVNAFIDGSLDALQEQTREHPPHPLPTLFACVLILRAHYGVGW